MRSAAIALLACLGISGGGIPTKVPIPPAVPTGREGSTAAPTQSPGCAGLLEGFAATGPDGAPVSCRDLAGRWVLLEFLGGTEGLGLRAALAYSDLLAGLHGPSRLVCACVRGAEDARAADPEGPPSGIVFRWLLWVRDGDRLAGSLGVPRGRSTTCLLDPTGTIRFRRSGDLLSNDQKRQLLERFLGVPAVRDGTEGAPTAQALEVGKRVPAVRLRDARTGEDRSWVEIASRHGAWFVLSASCTCCMLRNGCSAIAARSASLCSALDPPAIVLADSSQLRNAAAILAECVSRSHLYTVSRPVPRPVQYETRPNETGVLLLVEFAGDGLIRSVDDLSEALLRAR